MQPFETSNAALLSPEETTNRQPKTITDQELSETIDHLHRVMEANDIPEFDIVKLAQSSQSLRN